MIFNYNCDTADILDLLGWIRNFAIRKFAKFRTFFISRNFANNYHFFFAKFREIRNEFLVRNFAKFRIAKFRIHPTQQGWEFVIVGRGQRYTQQGWEHSRPVSQILSCPGQSQLQSCIFEAEQTCSAEQQSFNLQKRRHLENAFIPDG